jgi:hypothetical protein
MLGVKKARLALCALCIGLWSGVVTPLRAADYPKDRSAREMIRKAIEEVYLEPDVERAERILLGTIDACEYKCQKSTLARAYMYTGIVRGSGMQDQEGAFEAFVSALKMDRDVELDAVLATEDTLASWERAVASRPRRKPVVVATPEPTELPPTARSTEDEVCPPGLPACVAEGGRCESSVECRSGLACAKLAGARSKTCNEPTRCDNDAECGAGACVRGVCEEPNSTGSKSEAANWLGSHGAFDFAWLPATRGVCTVESNAAGEYSCFAGGRPYTRDPSSTGPGMSINGGFAPATTRALLSFDRAFGARWLAGLRAGLAFGGSEHGFLPFHAELRGRYLFGESWLRPFASLGAGIAQVDTRLPVHVRENADDPEPTAVEAHAAFGRYFGSGGAGVLLAPSDNVRFDLSLSMAAFFPAFGVALEPSAGVAIGL